MELGFLRHVCLRWVLCALVWAGGAAVAAPLKVVGAQLQDAHGNVIMLRGVNLPVYKSGWAEDLDAVAQAIARTKTNAVRLEWWANAPGGAPHYTVDNLDRAIQKYYSLGIIPVVELHDLTFQYGHNDPPGGALADGNDRALFASTITGYWTRPDVLAVLLKHQDHLIVNLANEWGSSFYSNGASAAANFVQNYTTAIAALRSAGITAPLMVDAPKGFEHQMLLDHGAELVAADPLGSTLLSVHAYWAVSDAGHSDASVVARLNALKATQLPIVLGEVSSNAYTVIPCDPVHYGNLLAHANSIGMGYLFWSWYEDGQCGQAMNITVGHQGDGVTLPVSPGFGYDALYDPAYGIDTAQPTTTKADFSPLNGPTLLNTSFGYNVTSTDDQLTRPATALVTRLDNFGAEKRPVIVFLPGWGGTGDVAAARDEQTTLFANQGYVALNVGFHQTSSGAWSSDLSEGVKAALDALCAQASYANCAAVLLVGASYGGTQTHPVVRYLRANGTFDGSAGANGGRKVLGLLGQDSGYTQYWAAPVDADPTAYSIAMIQNLGDVDLPVDSCDWGNCGARNRADFHQNAAGSQYVLSQCPAGGSHGSRGYADWNNWVLSAAKTMLHTQRGVAKFAGYTEPVLAVYNACVTHPNTLPDLVVTQLTAPASGQVGAAVSVIATVANQGGVAAAPSWMGLYLSTDGIIDAGDMDLGAGCAVPGLSPGGSFACLVDAVIPANTPAGAYFVGAKADHGLLVAESSETNNSRAAGAPTSITHPATAPICQLSASPTRIARGGVSVLTASCVPAATSYSWQGGSCAGTTVSQCTVSPAVSTAYQVTGSNAQGSDTASARVQVGGSDITPILMLLLD